MTDLELDILPMVLVTEGVLGGDHQLIAVLPGSDPRSNECLALQHAAQNESIMVRLRQHVPPHSDSC